MHHPTPTPTRILATAAVAATLTTLAVAGPADAATGAVLPQITALSSHRGDTDCGANVTIEGRNFDGVTAVNFGGVGVGFQVVSRHRIRTWVGAHRSAAVTVRVTTDAGRSPRSEQARYAWVRQAPSMHRTKLNCGMTATQEVAKSAQLRRTAARHTVAPVRRSNRWTAAMGRNAARRAVAWSGLPYSWAGGNTSGPTYGVSTSGPARWDSRVWGFDCSGLALYAWGPYRPLAHFAATQYRQAGSFHPKPSELVPGDLVFYTDNGHAGGIDHVQIYVGHGTIVQAPASGYPVGTATLDPAGRPFFAATRPLSHGRQAAVPHLNRLSTHYGPTGGSTVTAYGSGLNDVASVVVGGTRSYRFTSRSSHRLTIALPAHAAGRVKVRIGGAWGQSNPLRYTYVDAPQVAGVSPNSGAAAAAHAVMIDGRSFVGVRSVTVGGSAAKFTVTSGRKIRATLPALPAGTYPVVVTTAYGTSAGWASFTYLSAPPVSTAPPRPATTPTPTSKSRTSPTTAYERG